MSHGVAKDPCASSALPVPVRNCCEIRLHRHPQLVAVPHDVNFIWKYGNYHVPHDELTPADLSEKQIRFLRQFFDAYSGRRGGRRIIEKTVSNSIRVPFVRKVFPHCQFIHLIRDGRDVALSSMEQWRSSVELGRLSDKLKLFPLRAIPRYGLHYARSYAAQLLLRDKRVSSWGVRLKDLDQLLQEYSLLEVCGLQWGRCVDHTSKALASIPMQDQLEVRYETLVTNPDQELERVLTFLGLEMTAEAGRYIQDRVFTDSIGKWRRATSGNVHRLMLHIAETMARLGYLDEQQDPTSENALNVHLH